MALIGGGGAGNVAGGTNPAGTGTSLNYIGDHCYGYSGGLPIPNSNTTMLEFTTANNYIVAQVIFSGIDSTADDYGAFIDFNGEEVYGTYILNTSQTNFYGMEPIPIIIPPYTKVVVRMINKSTSSGYEWIASLTGRVYA